jgi:hypothetical protein
MNEKIVNLKKEIEELIEKKKDREVALPAHSIRPNQLLVIEELEEEIDQRNVEPCTMVLVEVNEGIKSLPPSVVENSEGPEQPPRDLALRERARHT